MMNSLMMFLMIFKDKKWNKKFLYGFGYAALV